MYDEPEREWPGSEHKPDPKQERLDDLERDIRQKNEDSPQ